jgi:hypothetical protein
MEAVTADELAAITDHCPELLWLEFNEVQRREAFAPWLAGSN